MTTSGSGGLWSSVSVRVVRTKPNVPDFLLSVILIGEIWSSQVGDWCNLFDLVIGDW